MPRYLDRIIDRFRSQEAKGINKYGQVLEQNHADIQERLEHLAQELSDGLMYIEWIKEHYQVMVAGEELRQALSALDGKDGN
jgi:hypothetical protein